MSSSMSAVDFRGMLQEGYAAGYLANDSVHIWVTDTFKKRYGDALTYLRTNSYASTLVFSVLHDLRTSGRFDHDRLQQFVLKIFDKLLLTEEHCEVYDRLAKLLEADTTARLASFHALITITLIEIYETDIVEQPHGIIDNPDVADLRLEAELAGLLEPDGTFKLTVEGRALFEETKRE